MRCHVLVLFGVQMPIKNVITTTATSPQAPIQPQIDEEKKHLP